MSSHLNSADWGAQVTSKQRCRAPHNTLETKGEVKDGVSRVSARTNERCHALSHKRTTENMSLTPRHNKLEDKVKLN